MSSLKIKKGDLVCSTWSLSRDPYVQPVTVTDVYDDGTVIAGRKGYHQDGLVVIKQRPKAEAPARRYVHTFSGCDFAEDCVLAFDLLLGADFDGEIPPWLAEVTAMVLPDRD